MNTNKCLRDLQVIYYERININNPVDTNVDDVDLDLSRGGFCICMYTFSSTLFFFSPEPGQDMDNEELVSYRRALGMLCLLFFLSWYFILFYFYLLFQFVLFYLVCFIQFYFILFYFVLFYLVLFYFILFYFILFFVYFV